ncbi:MAG: HAMP domain-containing histidine kinase [Acidobacteria bacterium]|nr:HAMP domain-containing histidine kinase [Acidobacteriota bacterium]
MTTDSAANGPDPAEYQTSQEAERAQTDQSLRLEREKVDDALSEHLAAIEETADTVIATARRRADTLLAAARADTDRHSQATGATSLIGRERNREDAAVTRERAVADQTLREERAEPIELLVRERGDTDNDLSVERERADLALVTRDQVLAIVSHDLRDMLGVVLGFAALIEKVPSGDQATSYARRIGRSGVRMERLVGDLVDVASIAAGALAVTREQADLTPVIIEAVDTFHQRAADAGVRLAVDLAPSLTGAAFDPARVLQVLTNLLTNAIKFSPPAGVVVVRASRVGDDIQVSVSDEGSGIPADKIEVVFERFLQVRQDDRRGVGLGLYIAKCIVQGHGGRIWADSQLGQGSTFSFTLPLAAPLADAAL